MAVINMCGDNKRQPVIILTAVITSYKFRFAPFFLLKNTDVAVHLIQK